jgi:hypothetical protein
VSTAPSRTIRRSPGRDSPATAWSRPAPARGEQHAPAAPGPTMARAQSDRVRAAIRETRSSAAGCLVAQRRTGRRRAARVGAHGEADRAIPEHGPRDATSLLEGAHQCVGVGTKTRCQGGEQVAGDGRPVRRTGLETLSDPRGPASAVEPVVRR